MSTEKFENEIREQRLIEATKRGYTGSGGKFSVILKTLGEPIVAHSRGGSFVETTYLDDPLFLDASLEDARSSEEIRDRMPMELDGDPDDPQYPPGVIAGTDYRDPSSPEWRQNPHIEQAGIEIIGWNFDGLSRGMHLEIRYMRDSSTLTCHYKGFEVYRETKGELMGYAPLQEWEDWIDRLHKQAKLKRGKMEITKSLENEKEAGRKKDNWWESFKLRWGL